MFIAPEFGYEMMDQNEYLELGKFVSGARMDSTAKWHELIAFWSYLHPPTTTK